ncbi:MAG: hypothetical protein LBP30_05740 [Clostridiales Family XIII bacterium]|nr:hypothetical protein [Clostridiales Family XIII bacterium]
MNAEELLKDVLAKDEVPEWTATPKPYSIFNDENKKSTMLFWTIAAVLLLALNIAYIAFCVLDEAAEFMAGVLVVTVGVPLFLFINPIRDEKHIAKQLLVITNKRAIVFHKSNKELSLPFESIGAVNIETSTDAECSHIRVGASVADAPARKLRGFAIMGKRDDDDKCIGFVFYHVDAREGKLAYDILREKIARRSDAV